MIGYFSNFDNMFKRMYSESIKKQAILIYRNDYDAFSECLVSDTNNLLNTYSVCPTTKAKLNLLQFKAICQCILDTQGIDGKTSEVLGNYKKKRLIFLQRQKKMMRIILFIHLAKEIIK